MDSGLDEDGDVRHLSLPDHLLRGHQGKLVILVALCPSLCLRSSHRAIFPVATWLRWISFFPEEHVPICLPAARMSCLQASLRTAVLVREDEVMRAYQIASEGSLAI